MRERSDEELVDRCMQRDERALRTIVDTYSAAVYGMARKVLADPHMSEEVSQDTFLALWRRPGAFDPQRGNLRSFLMGVARNKAIDLVRKEESARRAREALADMSEDRKEIQAPDDASEDRHVVQAALSKLTKVQREALVLAYFGGRTYREVAVELGIPEGTAKTRLRDGLLRLRELLADPPGMEERI